MHFPNLCLLHIFLWPLSFARLFQFKRQISILLRELKKKEKRAIHVQGNHACGQTDAMPTRVSGIAGRGKQATGQAGSLTEAQDKKVLHQCIPWNSQSRQGTIGLGACSWSSRATGTWSVPPRGQIIDRALAWTEAGNSGLLCKAQMCGTSAFPRNKSYKLLLKADTPLVAGERRLLRWKASVREQKPGET